MHCYHLMVGVLQQDCAPNHGQNIHRRSCGHATSVLPVGRLRPKPIHTCCDKKKRSWSLMHSWRTLWLKIRNMVFVYFYLNFPRVWNLDPLTIKNRPWGWNLTPKRRVTRYISCTSICDISVLFSSIFFHSPGSCGAATRLAESYRNSGTPSSDNRWEAQWFNSRDPVARSTVWHGFGVKVREELSREVATLRRDVEEQALRNWYERCLVDLPNVKGVR